jgi:thioesterase domain-containing protein
MGGVIAASVARVLESEGREVAFVGLIDSYLFEDDPFTVESDPLLGVSLAFGGTLVNAFTKLSPSDQQSFRQELLGMTPDDRLRRVMEWGQGLNVIPPDISFELLSDQVRLTERHDKLLRRHRAATIDAPLTVWWAADKNEGVLTRTDWSKYSRRGAHVEMAEGNHFTVVQPPGCYRLASQIEDRLAAARTLFQKDRLDAGTVTEANLQTTLSGD